MTMQELWARIDHELSHIAPLPRRQSWLRPGATEKQLATFQRRIGLPLSDDFCESYLLHNGSRADCVPWLGRFDRLLMLTEIAKNHTWRVNRGREVLPEPCPTPCNGPVASMQWSDGWITLAASGSGSYLCLDLDPLPLGTQEQVFDYNHEYGPTRWLYPSFRAYLEQFASDLEYGLIHHDAVRGWHR